MTVFADREITSRNLGFVSEDNQTRLNNACGFVCDARGVGASLLLNSTARITGGGL